CTQEPLFTAIRLLLHPRLVMLQHTGFYSVVERMYIEELSVTQRCKNTCVDHFYLILHQGFVLGPSCMRRAYSRAVMVGEVFHRLVQDRFVSVSLDDRCFQIIGNNGFGHTSQSFQATAECVQKVGGLLGGHSYGKS